MQVAECATQRVARVLAVHRVEGAAGGVELRVGQAQVDTPAQEPRVGVVLHQVNNPPLGCVEGGDVWGDHGEVGHLIQQVSLNATTEH